MLEKLEEGAQRRQELRNPQRNLRPKFAAYLARLQALEMRQEKLPMLEECA